MRALTIRQPWASLIAKGVKTIETRGWQTKYRGPLLIHAGLQVEPGRVGRWTVWNESGWVWWLDARDGDPESSDYEALTLGAVVAVCTLVDVVPIVAEDDVFADRNGCRTGERGFVFHGARGLDRYYWNGWRYELILSADTEAQRPYGDFTPARYAWLLADVRPLTSPVPAKGRQGLWTPDADLIDAVEAL